MSSLAHCVTSARRVTNSKTPILLLNNSGQRFSKMMDGISSWQQFFSLYMLHIILPSSQIKKTSLPFVRFPAPDLLTTEVDN
jgi:hypothetical protein